MELSYLGGSWDSRGDERDAALKRSIMSIGIRVPIKCRANGEIIDGVRRYRAALELREEGHTVDVPTEVVL